MRKRFLTPSIADLDGRSARRFFCVDTGLSHYLTGAIEELTSLYNWEKFGDIDPVQMVEMFEEVIGTMGNCSLVGTIFSTIGELPDNCLWLDGGVVASLDYPELSLIAPSWRVGSDLVLPDMANAYLVGASPDAGIFVGANQHTLTIEEIPAHTHDYSAAVASVTTVVVPDEPSAVPANLPSSPSGGGFPHNNMPYSLTVKWAIYAK